MVEVKSGGLIVVRVPVVSSCSSSFSSTGAVLGQGYGEGAGAERGVDKEMEAVVDEKMERRLGFEVVEWVRSGGWVNIAREGQMAMEY